MFSVVIPLYNKELSISNTIQSVLNQTFQNFEIVVVNDGSTDNSLEVVKQINDSRIRVINKPNGGVSSARNRGIEESNFEWIAFLDGDDLWEKFHLEEIVKMMKVYPKEKVYVTSFEYSDGRKMYRHPRSSNIFKIENYFKEAIKENLICSIIIVIHKDCFETSGVFNEQLNRGEDLDLWARLARSFDIIKSKKVTATYRVDAENRSNQTFDLIKNRVYYFDFNSKLAQSEINYYKNEIINRLKELLRKRDLISFLKLKHRFSKQISYWDIIKSLGPLRRFLKVDIK